jgi:hypothetical protein
MFPSKSYEPKPSVKPIAEQGRQPLKVAVYNESHVESHIAHFPAADALRPSDGLWSD